MSDPQDEDVFRTWLARRQRGAGLIDLYNFAAEARGVAVGDLSASDRARLTALALPIIEPGFEVIANSDRRDTDRIELVAYDITWPRQFEAWRVRLLAVLTHRPQRIDHVGSTSVPGLAAKPIIDILISVDDMRDENAYVPAIESLGVQLRSRNDERRFFRPFSDRPRDVHIHVCDAESQFERRTLRFRDLLRNDPKARTEYLAAKQEAARRWGHDRIAYTDAKSEVIERLLSQA